MSGKYLDAINRDLVDKIKDAKLAEGVTHATVNRMMEVVRAILRRCVNEWEWLDRAPHVKMLKEPTRRIRYLTRNEAQRLLAKLPEHLGRHGGIFFSHRITAGECHRFAVVAD